MPIQFHCPSCRQPIEVDEVYAEKEVGCPYCRKVVTAPPAGTLIQRPPQARAVGEGPAQRQAGRLEEPSSAPPPPFGPPRAGRLARIGLMLSVGGLLVYLAGSMAALSVLEEYAQKKNLKLHEAPLVLQQDWYNGKPPPRPGLFIVGVSLSCLGFMADLAGLVCSLIALFQPGGRKSWAIAGTVIGLILPMQLLLALFG